MTDVSELVRTLTLVATKLNELKVDWILGSSASLMVQGIDIVPHDIDILVRPQYLSLVDSLLHQIVPSSTTISVDFLPFSGVADVSLVDYHGLKIPVDSLSHLLLHYQKIIGKEDVVYKIKQKLQ